jgi:CheY-like chemotaxis protein/HPt (histidine-containing phosphotransfer) domain-containing protein
MIANRKILLVEDSESDRYLLMQYLQSLGYECDSFVNGNELVKKLKDYPSSVILLDIELPVMNGIETAMHIRKHFSDISQRFIIIGLTAHTDSLMLTKIADAGFDDCLEKPLRKKILEEKLHQYVGPATPRIEKRKAPSTNQHDDKRLYTLDSFDGTDPGFMRSIVALFVISAPAMIQEMKEAFDKADYEQLRQLAHKLRPHFEYFGVADVSANLRETEEHARFLSKLDTIPDLLSRITEAGAEVVGQLKHDFVLENAH